MRITRERACRILERHWKLDQRIAKAFGRRLNGQCILCVNERPVQGNGAGRTFVVGRGKSWLEALTKWVPEKVVREG